MQVQTRRNLKGTNNGKGTNLFLCRCSHSSPLREERRRGPFKSWRWDRMFFWGEKKFNGEKSLTRRNNQGTGIRDSGERGKEEKKGAVRENEEEERSEG